MTSLLLATALTACAAHAAPVVYGYLPYWQDPEIDVPWDHITHLGLFAAEVDSAGRLTSTASWRSVAPAALAEADGRGVQVELVLAVFDEDRQRAALGSAASRTALADALEEFEGGVVIISHDSRLLSRVCDDAERSEVWIVDNGVIEHYDGDFEDFKGELISEIQEELDEDEREEAERQVAMQEASAARRSKQ